MKLRSKHGGGRVRSGWALLVLALTVLLLSPSATAHRMRGSSEWRGAHQFNRVPGNISGFHRHNGAPSRGGHFVHGRHHGHFGWWWVNAGLWYSYPATVYAYPYPDEPPVAVASAPLDVGPAIQYWSFCEASGAYYPNVTTCPGGWKQVQVPLNDASPVPQQ